MTDQTEFKPGEKVERSGIYRVLHDSEHTEAHEVTCIDGKTFPPCGHCSHPRFTLVRAAQHIDDSDHFK